jgi:hypothetical protein
LETHMRLGWWIYSTYVSQQGRVKLTEWITVPLDWLISRVVRRGQGLSKGREHYPHEREEGGEEGGIEEWGWGEEKMWSGMFLISVINISSCILKK